MRTLACALAIASFSIASFSITVMTTAPASAQPASNPYDEPEAEADPNPDTESNSETTRSTSPPPRLPASPLRSPSETEEPESDAESTESDAESTESDAESTESTESDAESTESDSDSESESESESDSASESESASAPRWTDERVIAWSTFGASLAVAIAGAVIFAAGVDDINTVENAPAGSAWSSGYEDARDRAPLLTGSGAAILAVGAAGTIAGAILLALFGEEGTWLSAHLGGAGVRGAF